MFLWLGQHARASLLPSPKVVQNCTTGMTTSSDTNCNIFEKMKTVYTNKKSILHNCVSSHTAEIIVKGKRRVRNGRDFKEQTNAERTTNIEAALTRCVHAISLCCLPEYWTIMKFLSHWWTMCFKICTPVPSYDDHTYLELTLCCKQKTMRPPLVAIIARGKAPPT